MRTLFIYQCIILFKKDNYNQVGFFKTFIYEIRLYKKLIIHHSMFLNPHYPCRPLASSKILPLYAAILMLVQAQQLNRHPQHYICPYPHIKNPIYTYCLGNML